MRLPRLRHRGEVSTLRSTRPETRGPRRWDATLALALVIASCAPATPPAPDPTPRAGVSGTPTPVLGLPSPTLVPPSPPPSSAPPTGPPSAPPTIEPTASPTAPPPSAGPITGPLDPNVTAALQAVVAERQRALRIPGMVVTIRLVDGQEWTGTSGLAVVRPRRPVKPDTPFAIASITKTFVTALVMQLVEEGRISLDDRLARWLPDFPHARRITLRMLLNHTSGIHNYFESRRYAREVFRQRGRVWTFEEILGLVGEPYFPPGRSLHYSNTGFVLLGRVVEEVTGRRLSAEIRDRLVDPLGLERTAFQYEEPTPRGAAHGHLIFTGGVVDWTDGTQRVPNTSAVTVAWAAGAMAASAPDLARWASALYTGRVVSTESLAQMTDFSAYPEYGLGTRSHRFVGRLAVGHTGGIRGFSTAMWHLPVEGVTVVVLANRGFVDPNRITADVLRTLFRSLGVARPA